MPGKELDENQEGAGKLKINRTDIIVSDVQKGNIINIKIDKSQDDYLLTEPFTESIQPKLKL